MNALSVPAYLSIGILLLPERTAVIQRTIFEQFTFGADCRRWIQKNIFNRFTVEGNQLFLLSLVRRAMNYVGQKLPKIFMWTHSMSEWKVHQIWSPNWWTKSRNKYLKFWMRTGASELLKVNADSNWSTDAVDWRIPNVYMCVSRAFVAEIEVPPNNLWSHFTLHISMLRCVAHKWNLLVPINRAWRVRVWEFVAVR